MKGKIKYTADTASKQGTVNIMLEFLTKIVISQHFLNLLSDGISIELGRHRHHLLDAETRMAW